VRQWVIRKSIDVDVMDRDVATSLGVPPGNAAVELTTASYEQLKRDLRRHARLTAAIHRGLHTAVQTDFAHTVYLGGGYKLCCAGNTVQLVHMRLAVPEDGNTQTESRPDGQWRSSVADVV
jgi:hypothetical protein